MLETYSKEVMDLKIDKIESLIRSQHDDTMTAIGTVRVQTTETNGQVRWVTKMIYMAMGGLIVISAFAIPSIGWLFTHSIDTSNQVAGMLARLDNK